MSSFRKHEGKEGAGSFLSEDPFDSNIDEISESGLSFSISMIQDKIQ